MPANTHISFSSWYSLFMLLLLLSISGCNGLPSSGPLRQVDLDEALALLKQKPEMVILDVRTPKEYDDGHVKGALHENYYAGSFEANLKTYDKSKAYLVYCKTGGRGKNALKIMIKLGFKEAYNLRGGYEIWAEKGLPTAIRKPSKN